jgi:hypothetical protein
MLRQVRFEGTTLPWTLTFARPGPVFSGGFTFWTFFWRCVNSVKANRKTREYKQLKKQSLDSCL